MGKKEKGKKRRRGEVREAGPGLRKEKKKMG